MHDTSEPLLLIVGGESDPNTFRIAEQARARGDRHLFWNTDLDSAHRIAWDFDSPQIDLESATVQPTSVYVRYNVFEGDPERNLASFETIQSYVLAWPEIRVLNRTTMMDGNNKSKNLRLAKDVGFEIPETLVMSDLTPLASMPNPNAHAMKPLGGGAHTVLVSDVCEDMDKLSDLGPQFIQSRLDGENLRVFSIAGQQFCFRLVTTKLDYREDEQVDVVQVEMPPSLIEPTSHLVNQIGFDYCALDFRCKQGMEAPVFLEVNSFPMFVRFDDAANHALADTVLEFLTQAPK